MVGYARCITLLAFPTVLYTSRDISVSLAYPMVVYIRSISLLACPMVMNASSDIGLAYPTVVYARFILQLAYPMAVYIHYWHTQLPALKAVNPIFPMVVHPRSIAFLAYPTVVYARSISLLAYPTAVYVHERNTQLSCNQSSEPFVPNGCAPYINSIVSVPNCCVHKMYFTASVPNGCLL